MQSTSKSAWALSALDYELQRISAAPTRGEARKALLRSAASLYEIEAAGLLDSNVINAHLTQAAIQATIPVSDIRRSLNWGAKKGALNPRSPKPKFSEPTHINERRVVINDWYAQVFNDPTHNSEDVKVAYAFASLALKCGKTRISVSHRQLAEALDCSFQSVGARVAKLSSYVLLHTKGNRITGKSSVWQLALDGSPINTSEGVSNVTCRRQNTQENELMSPWLPPTPNGTTEFVESSELLDPSHGLWKRRSNAWLLFSLLATGETFTIKGIAKALGLNDRTVRNNLRYLATAGLAAQLGEDDGFLWEVLTCATPVNFASTSKESRRSRHELDRKAHKMWVTNRIEVTKVARNRRNHARMTAKAMIATNNRKVETQINVHPNPLREDLVTNQVLWQGS